MILDEAGSYFKQHIARVASTSSPDNKSYTHERFRIAAACLALISAHTGEPMDNGLLASAAKKIGARWAHTVVAQATQLHSTTVAELSKPKPPEATATE